MCISVLPVCACLAWRSWRPEPSDGLRLELWMAVSLHVGLGMSARATGSLNCRSHLSQRHQQGLLTYTGLCNILAVRFGL